MGSELILRGTGPTRGVKERAPQNIWPVMDGWSKFLERINKTECFQLRCKSPHTHLIVPIWA